eukprot:TRINITY_DN3190_c0_g4_i2.p1 TRINITY_DN3190_c0_g4~~TRINITY_DN3190_c0_g4_i2.p1  ORF type:complete len:273 (-),score=49.92 TRINITY_DN3190_c0_g4_i2:518-1336(-)
MNGFNLLSSVSVSSLIRSGDTPCRLQTSTTSSDETFVSPSKREGLARAQSLRRPESPLPSNVEKGINVCKVLIRTTKTDRIFSIPGDRMTKGPKQGLKFLKEQFPEYSGIQFKIHKNHALNDELLKAEMCLMVKGYKFGILYNTKDNQTEDDFYLNNDEGEDLQEFINWIGQKILLKGWQEYSAGLDTKDNKTGEYGLYTQFENFNVMFHVSTMIPFTEDDPQQLARKCHLGNDIVIILFQEEAVHMVMERLSPFVSVFPCRKTRCEPTIIG